jgi:hypothetical protein
LTQEQVVEVQVLKKRGWSIRQIARQMGMLSTSVFSVVYFSIDVARRELAIANTSCGRRKIKFPPLYAALRILGWRHPLLIKRMLATITAEILN